MSTRARIALALPNGKFKSIYTHWDGYPAHHAPILQAHYSTLAQVKALLALGNLSRLAPQLAPPSGQSHDYDAPIKGVTVAYRRDRGDKGNGAVTSINFTALAALACEWNAEYLYVFADGRWSTAPLSWAAGAPMATVEQLQQVAV